MDLHFMFGLSKSQSIGFLNEPDQTPCVPRQALRESQVQHWFLTSFSRGEQHETHGTSCVSALRNSSVNKGLISSKGKGNPLVCHPAWILPMLTCAVSQALPHSVNNKRCAGAQEGAEKAATLEGCPSSPWHGTRPTEYKEDTDPFILIPAHWCSPCQELLASLFPSLIHLSRPKSLDLFSKFSMAPGFPPCKSFECPTYIHFIIYYLVFAFFRYVPLNSNPTSKVGGLRSKNNVFSILSVLSARM